MNLQSRRWPASLRAFGHRNFRVFFAGQGISQVGNWLQLIATSWLIYRLTGSTWMLGLATFALQIPYLVLGPLAGVLVDRLNIRRVLLAVHTVACLQALCMLALVASGGVQPWHLIAGNLVLGLANAFEAPSRQSLLVHLVGQREDIPNAIALNSLMMNGARFVGPMIGGAVIAAFGETWGFGLNMGMRLAVITSLLALHVPRRHLAAPEHGFVGQFVAGVRYAYGFLPSRCALLLLAATSVTVQSYSSLMPWFARERFHGDSQTLGWLISAAGFGAVTAMAYLAQKPTVRGLFRQMGLSAGLGGLALICFSFSEPMWLALAMLYVTGLTVMLTAAATNTVLQTIVPDELRGRVASLYVLSFLGLSPLGALWSGWMAEQLGAPHALALNGLMTLVAASLYMLQMLAIRRAIKPVYQRLGIMPASSE